MTTLQLVSDEAVCPPAHGSGAAEADRGDVEALARLLATAIDQNGFGKYREQQAGAITAGVEECRIVPADRLEWRHLAAVEVEKGEGAVLSVWEDVKRAAREELSSGHQAASVMEGRQATPMERARFLVLRESFAAEWQPRGGLEWQLIDQLSQAATGQAYWTAKLTMQTQQEAAEDLRDRQKLEGQKEKSLEEKRREQVYRWGEWIPPRVTTAEAIQEAVVMVDRFNRMFLRCLRQLRDLRRYNVVIQGAGQVNIGEKQVNVSQQDRNKQEARPVKRAKAKRRRL